MTKAEKLYRDFNPRPPCGGRLSLLLIFVNSFLFQSTSPVWRTTMNREESRRAAMISIHVPRVEDDVDNPPRRDPRCHFNPRPPCGGRPSSQRSFLTRCRFQSTSPVWRTTADSARRISAADDFNPRPPCGGRLVGSFIFLHPRHFNPRPPCGGRPARSRTTKITARFQSTSPVWRTTAILH